MVNLSGYGRKWSEEEEHTCWNRQILGLVRTQKKSASKDSPVERAVGHKESEARWVSSNWKKQAIGGEACKPGQGQVW